MMILACLCWGWTGCGEDTDSDTNMTGGVDDTGSNSAQPDAGLEMMVPDSASAEADTAEPVDDTSTPLPPVVGRCDYINPFSQGDECKEYTGAGWTEGTATEDCGAVLPGIMGTFVVAERCAFDNQLGTCLGGSPEGEGYAIISAGDDTSLCAPAEVGCTLLGGERFELGNTCMDEEPVVTDPTQGGVFIPPFEECVPPREGEPAGNGPDGTVCTQQAISGATEPGRRYEDYGRCEVVLSQRPYYPVPPAGPAGAEDDPRLDDPVYMEELTWVTEQIEATACTCCHVERLTPNGPSNWYTDAGVLWVDTMADSGVAMMAGLADSTAFGAFAPERNNGFDRDTTGTPTTDIERMRAFFVAELERRGASTREADYEPFGGPLYNQLIFEPPRCDTQGITAEQGVYWTGGTARYVYILEADALNPGVPPNLDRPEGTLWKLDVPPDNDPIERGFGYGTLPEGAVQAWPEGGEPAPLTVGEDYYLYVLRDVALPVTRCIFTYGE
ncbi:MAG: proteinase inhibitor [Myxococcota bacterium]